MKPLISIIYVYFNTPKELVNSLKSIKDAVGYFSYEVIVVDNNSPKHIPSKFFDGQAKHGNFNPVHAPTNPWTNLTLRGEDVVLLSHFPCCSECEKSIEMAKRNLDLLEKYNSALANSFIEKLSAYRRNSVTGT